MDESRSVEESCVEEITNEEIRQDITNEEIMQETNNEFAFETDHIALRTNEDYCELLKYIVQLEAQKCEAIKDIDTLVEIQNKALEDPINFALELKNGKIILPSRQVVPEIPKINWEKYGIDPSLEKRNHCDIKPNEIESNTVVKIRGREFDDNKPETFNQLWSLEEQNRLEELLEVYAEEPIESRRYKKIAEALGTRTTLQVISRVQKYFAKLAKAGLPIPGRVPKRLAKEKQKNRFYRKSTFFPDLHVPIKMEETNDPSEISESVSCTGRVAGNKEILELLKLANEHRKMDEISPIWQNNVLCVGCQKTRFLGARWTDNAGTDYCTDCVVKLLPPEKLTPSRRIT